MKGVEAKKRQDMHEPTMFGDCGHVAGSVPEEGKSILEEQSLVGSIFGQHASVRLAVKLEDQELCTKVSR